MTKKDEFIEKIEQLDPHLKVAEYNKKDVYACGEEVDMIVWYETNNDWKAPFVTFAHYGSKPMAETGLNHFSKDDLVLYSKVVKLCADYFSYLFQGGLTMTKTDEFIEQIKRLDPHLKVQKPGYAEVDMVIWYIIDDDFRYPFVTFTVDNCGKRAVKTHDHLLVKDDLVLYQKVLKLFVDYFSYLD